MGEECTSTGDAGADGARWDVEGLGDLGVVQVAEVSQHDRSAEVVRQGRQRCIHSELIGDSLGSGGGRHRGRRPVVVGQARIGPAPAPAQLVEAGIRGHAVHPCCKGCAAIEPGEPSHYRDQRLLRGVLRICLLPADPSAESVHTVMVPSQQSVQRSPITLLGSADEGARRRCRQ